jgi:hypothetical protein
MYWLFEAIKRFGLCVLNFTVTSNHVHLLIYDTGNGNETIPKSIQLIAGKTGQEFNRYWVGPNAVNLSSTTDVEDACVSPAKPESSILRLSQPA